MTPPGKTDIRKAFHLPFWKDRLLASVQETEIVMNAFRVSIIITGFLLGFGTPSTWALSPEEAQILKAFPECDLNGDGELAPGEIWHARTKTRQQGDYSWKLAQKLVEESYAPAPVDKNQSFGPKPGKKIKLFILSGQSNMVGQGMSAEIPKSFLPLSERILMFEEGRWQPLQPLDYWFGPEISFAHYVARIWPEETIGIVKQSEGGTGVLAWNPNWTKEKADLTGDARKGNLWKALTEKVQAAREAADCEVKGFIWMQGGKDMQNLVTGENYLENLSALVNGLRKETGYPHLPLVLGSYRIPAVPDNPHEFDFSALPETVRPGYAQVLKAQYDAQFALAPAKMIPLRDVESYPKNVHFNTTGQLKLGKLFAEGYLELAYSIP